MQNQSYLLTARHPIGSEASVGWVRLALLSQKVAGLYVTIYVENQIFGELQAWQARRLR